jgi:hypothetical protein
MPLTSLEKGFAGLTCIHSAYLKRRESDSPRQQAMRLHATLQEAGATSELATVPAANMAGPHLVFSRESAPGRAGVDVLASWPRSDL